jgi:negative regulator of flagellin synthesis FlgM
MKIDKGIRSNLTDSLIKSAQTKAQETKAVDVKQSRDSFDKVELSGRDKDLKTLIEKAKAVPTVRQDKVDSIREAIQNGTYNVEGKLVAKSVIKSGLLDEII